MKCLVMVLILNILISSSNEIKIKRQIYREQVLPLTGGKIPEDAFRADRLALNRLNKEGIAIPDGILLEQRSPHSHPQETRHDPEDEDSVLQIIQQQEQRFAPEEGRYHNSKPETVPSTYLIRKPIGREETNILTPDQQRPLHVEVYLRQRNGGYQGAAYHPQRYQPPPPPPVQQHQTHHSFHYSQPKQHAYYPIPVPFVLPNQEVQDEKYFTKNYENGYQGNEVTGQIQFPLIFKNSREFEGLFPYEYDVGFDEPTSEFYGNSEPFGTFESFFSAVNGRFGRKSTEGFHGGPTKSKTGQRSSSRSTIRWGTPKKN